MPKSETPSQFPPCSLHQATSLLGHAVPFLFNASQVQPSHFTKHHPTSRAEVPFPPPASPESHSWPLLAGRWHRAALALFHEKEKRHTLEAHQHRNPGKKARRQWKAVSISQFGQNNRAKCFLQMTDHALWTACRALLRPREEDPLLCVAHAAILAKHTHKLCMYLPDHGGTMARPPVGRPLLDDGRV